MADAAFVSASVIEGLPANVDFIGRGRPDAALYAPPKRNRLGRPRKKGERVASPEQRARASQGWQRLRLAVYGRSVALQVMTFEALWYAVSGGRCLRFVVVRGWPGHKHDDVLCSTNLGLDAATIISQYCLRWSLEVTFHEAKGRLGFEEPQNRTDKAVERTAPMALLIYSLTVIWYLSRHRSLWPAGMLPLPWYRKFTPAFSDMVALLRREIWQHRLSMGSSFGPDQRKSLAPLVDALAYAA